MSGRQSRDDGGFTVLELLIAMFVMLIITVPLVTSFVLGLTTTRDGLQDTTNSADAQALAAFFDVDVAGAQQVAKGVTNSCGGASVLELIWSDAGTTHTVAYRLVAADADVQQDVSEVAAGQVVQKLERVLCAGSAAPVVTPVARSVTGTTVTCDGLTTCPASPSTVTLQVVQFSALVKDQAASSNRFTMAVTATRKVTAP